MDLRIMTKNVCLFEIYNFNSTFSVLQTAKCTEMDCCNIYIADKRKYFLRKQLEEILGDDLLNG